MPVEFDPQQAVNDFVSVRLVPEPGSPTPSGDVQRVVFELRIAFSSHETRTVQFGLKESRLRGRLQGCSATRLDGGKEGQTVHRRRRTKGVVQKEAKDSAGVKVTNPATAGELGSQSTRGTTTESEDTSEFDDVHDTFFWFAEGAEPEWHFRHDAGKWFLSGPREVKVGLTIDSLALSPTGVITSNVLQEIRMLDLQGKALPWYMEMAARHKLKNYLAHNLKVVFSISP